MKNDKWKLAEEGVQHAKAFCKLNKLKEPKFELIGPDDRRYFLNSCGFYRPGSLVVMPDKCASLGYGGRCWSWPGHMVDRTAYGVVAHEVGHLVHDVVIGWNTNLKKVIGEPKLTSYCDDHREWLAEMLRLFVTNPDLLKRVRPATYATLSSYVKPVEKRKWREVLGPEAPQRTVDLLDRRVEEVVILNKEI